MTIVSFHPTSPGQAAWTHVHSIANGLRDSGWRVTVVAPPSFASPRSLILRARAWVKTLLAAAITLPRCDVLYLRSHPAGAPLVAAARRLSTPVVVEVNGPDEDYLAAWPQLRRAPWLITYPIRQQLRRADAVIAVTEGLAEWARQGSQGVPISVVPNGVDETRFRPSGMGYGPTRPYVLFVGALAPWQGIGDLLAASERQEWPQEVELVIAGDGAEQAAVRRSAERQPTTVRWLGHVAPDRVPALLDSALAAAVLSRDRHGTGVSPIKLYEAMASATPVIVADVRGVADTVRASGCGVVVPPGDIGAIAITVAQLAAAPRDAEAMGQRGRFAALNEHTWSARAASTAEVLQAVLDRGDRP